MIPIFKSRYSLGKSILDVSEELETKPGYADNLIKIALDHELKELVIVEDSMTSFLIIYNACKKYNLKMRFGLRVNFCSDISSPKPEELHKNIVFLKESKGYESLVKVSTFAATHPFEGAPLIDYPNFHKLRTGLELVVPYFDSFLYKNSVTFGCAVPDFRNLNPKFLIEKNGLPEDKYIEKLLAPHNPILAKSIYYKDEKDVFALMTRKLMEKNGGRRATLECPNLDNFSSNQFSWEGYLEYNGV